MHELSQIGYLLAAVLFIFGLKFMAKPRTAVRGNIFGAIGMLVATGVALINRESYVYIGLGIIIGAAVGGVLAYKIQMTAMPQLVALFNGFGGFASVFVAGGELIRSGKTSHWDVLLAVGVSGIIGAVTFS